MFVYPSEENYGTSMTFYKEVGDFCRDLVVSEQFITNFRKVHKTFEPRRFGRVLGFFKNFTVAFLLFLAPAESSNPVGP